MYKKENLLFIILAGFFVANALIAEFIGVKVFSLENTFGMESMSIDLFGIENLGFNLTAGVLLWPVIFVMTDIINDYYDVKGVRILSILSSVLISYGFLMFFCGIHLVPAGFWSTSHVPLDATAAEKAAILAKVSDYDYAFRLVFGQGLWIIAGSISAFLIGQVLDAYIFRRIKRATGDRMIWLRATGSTLISQFFDSFLVLFVAFYLSNKWSFSTVIAIGIVNYFFKFMVALLLTPGLYLIHWLIEMYLGKEKAAEMRAFAAADASEQ